jgi:DNA-damage-inducible protein J
MKTEFVRARIEPDLKQEVHHLFDEIGITPSQAITIFYKLVQREHGLPFDMRVPNKKTVQTFKDTDEGKNLTFYENSDEMFKKLGM